MNIYWHELRSHRQSVIVWSLSISIISVLFILIYPSYSKDVDAIKQVFANYPPALIKAFSLNIDIFFSFLGFYSYILTYIIMAGAVQSLNLGISTVSKESTDKTADFLLTKPVSRGKIISQKLLASITILLATNIVFIISTFVAAKSVTSIQNNTIFFLLASTLFITQIIFLALGLVISVYANRIKSVIAISLPVVFLFYILSTFQSIFNIALFKYLSPLKYFDSSYIIVNKTYDKQFVGLSFAIVIICLVISYLHYSNKDINVN